MSGRCSGRRCIRRLGIERLSGGVTIVRIVLVEVRLDAGGYLLQPIG